MKLIKDKKLFGLINLVDIILILIIAVGGFLAYKFVFKGDSNSISIGQKYVPVKYTIRLENLPEGAHEYIKEGDSAYDNETNVYIGKVVSYISGDFISYRENNETNEFVSAVVPTRETVFLTIEVEVSDQGSDLITANNYYIKVGKPISVRTGQFAGDGYLSFIERLDLNDNNIEASVESKTTNSGEELLSGEKVYECSPYENGSC